MIFNDDSQDLELVSDINMVPFIDIMLVLLVVFMITVPVMTSQLDIQLPQSSTATNESKPKAITLFLTADGKVSLDDQSLTQIQLQEKLTAIALQKPQPVVHLEADKNTRYQVIMDTLLIAKNAGVNTLGFVFES